MVPPMSDQPQAEVNQLVIVSGHRLLTLAVFDPESDDMVSAIYEHSLGRLGDEPVEPLLDANAEITSVLAEGESALVFGTIDGEVVFTGGDDDEEMDGVEASGAAISALVQTENAILACTTDGEVLALAENEVTPWKTEGPALFAIAHLDGVTWIAGDEGYLARREGEGWKVMDTGTTESLQSLAPIAGGIVAAGDGGAVVQVQGDEVTLRIEGEDDLGGVAIWRGVPVLAAGDSGLRELTTDGTKLLREGACERVAADDKYLVISSDGVLLVTEDGVVWTPLAFSAPEPHDEHDHEHVHGEDCDHEH